MHQTSFLSNSAYAGVYVTQVFVTSAYTFAYSGCRVCTCARVCAFCSLALGHKGARQGGEVELVYGEHLLLGMGDGT